MSEQRAKTGSSSNSAMLLLLVRRVSGQTDEFYLANGLTIGRTVANTVVLEDDVAVDRTHARVDFCEDGTAKLRCVGDDNRISVGDTTVQEVGLTAGVRFRVGATEFDCVSGRKAPEPTLRGPTCPACGSHSLPPPCETPVPCPGCGQPILVLSVGAGFSSPLVVPVKYGEYQAERYVARGGMGLILRGFAVESKRPVALKVLLSGSDVDQQAAVRFEQEINLMKRVSHPNVVAILGDGRAEPFSFLVMDWIEGHSLRDVITDFQRRRQLPQFADVLRWFTQVCKGLAAVHAVGIIHRDIKPSNILIAQDGHVLLADLGVGKRADANQTALTTTGQLPGTYEYMAPEQLSSPDTVDQRTDLYSLGVTFYELLTGDRPVGAWLPASQMNSTVPRMFDQILAKMLARKSEHRYADIHEILAAILGLVPPLTSPPPPRPSWLTKALRLASIKFAATRTTVAAICAAAIAHIRVLIRIGMIRRKTRNLVEERQATCPSSPTRNPLDASTIASLKAEKARLAREHRLADLLWFLAPLAAVVAVAFLFGLTVLVIGESTSWKATSLDSTLFQFIMIGIVVLIGVGGAYFALWKKFTRRRRRLEEIEAAIRGPDEVLRTPYLTFGALWLGLAMALIATGQCFTSFCGMPLADPSSGLGLPFQMLGGLFLLVGLGYFVASIIGLIRRLIRRSKLRAQWRPGVGLAAVFLWMYAMIVNGLPMIVVAAHSASRVAAESRLKPALADLEKGEWDRAIDDLTGIIQLDPKFGEAYYNRALAYINKGEWDNAIADCTEAIGLKPDYAEAYLFRGVAYKVKQEYDKAIEDFTATIRLKPDYGKAYGYRGVVYVMKQEYNRAIADYNDAIMLDPKDAEAYNFRAIVYEKIGETAKAEDDHKRARELGYKSE